MAQVTYVDDQRLPTTELITFVAIFVTCLITAQLIASKILTAEIPLLAWEVTLPAGTLAYAGTFFATDCMNELYGKDFARRVVNISFVMNFLMLGLVWTAIWWPAAPYSIDPAMFENVLGAGTNIVAGSLLAYIVSQNFDVSAFAYIRGKTNGDHLWIRNIGSTTASQLIDTAIFTVIAFAIAPLVFGVGVTLGATAIALTIAGQFVGKLIIAVVDTPLVYAATGAVKNYRA